MIQISDRQKAKLKTLPAAPGVYFHKNKSGEIIYVGKAAVLKNRVRQYFQNTEKDPKTAALVAEIADTDWIIVDTEMDALFLESEMIKRYKPKWNILLRDDKTVSYVRIDLKSEIPYVSMTRTPMDDKATYVGPFYGKSAVQKALRILRRVFPYYDKPYDGKKTLNTDLGLTPGIEVGKSTPTEYKKNLRKLIRYLEGGREKLIRDLEKQMKTQSALGNYEAAAELRNQYFGLRELKKKIVFSDKEFLDISSDQALLQLQKLLNLAKPPRRIEGYDISHQSGANAVASMVVFTNGVSDRAQYRKFKIRQSKNDDYANMREVISRRLKHKEWEYPDLIVLDGSVGQISAVYDLLSAVNIPVIGRDKSGDHGRNAPVVLVLPGRELLVEIPDHTDVSPPSTPVTEKHPYPFIISHNSDFVKHNSNQTVSTPVTPSSSSSSTTATHTSPQASAHATSASPKPTYTFHPLPPSSHIARLIARIDEESHRFAITYHHLLQRKTLLGK